MSRSGVRFPVPAPPSHQAFRPNCRADQARREIGSSLAGCHRWPLSAPGFHRCFDQCANGSGAGRRLAVQPITVGDEQLIGHGSSSRWPPYGRRACWGRKQAEDVRHEPRGDLAVAGGHDRVVQLRTAGAWLAQRVVLVLMKRKMRSVTSGWPGGASVSISCSPCPDPGGSTISSLSVELAWSCR